MYKLYIIRIRDIKQYFIHKGIVHKLQYKIEHLLISELNTINQVTIKFFNAKIPSNKFYVNNYYIHTCFFFIIII